MKFELEVEREQKNPKIRRVEKMLAQPILKMKEESNQLIVNFDPRLVMMLRENERLCKLDIAMPRYLIAFSLTPLLCSRQRATVPGEKEGLVPQLSRRGRANVGHLHLHHDIACPGPQVLHRKFWDVLRCSNQEAVCSAPQQSESEPGPGNGPD